jgi:gag-polyprotein putative aspartyl protease
MKFPYDSHYFPPTPSVEIWLGTPGESLASGPHQALVDTGADISLVPLKHIKPLQTVPDDHRYLRSQWAERRRGAIYSLDVGIGNMRFPSVEVVADERSAEIILGRNVLNRLVVTLDGPNRVTEILD